MQITNREDIICALSTPQGVGAIAVIRLSGAQVVEIMDKIFSKPLKGQKTHTVHFGTIKNGERFVDEVLVTWLKGPHSFTGEDTAEISCHGSPYIQQEIIQLLLKSGARLAEPGEFTMRAFMNGKMDLSQAEAVADLIASESSASHEMAMSQMRGGFSKTIKELREKLIHFASLIELELDFVEEDVEFADRDQLMTLVREVQKLVHTLIESFSLGNVIKNGVPVAIVGAPNVGKSTLLNALLNEEKAIVSEIAGTTRDVIEDEISLDGMVYRFIDTAGLRQTDDKIESMGISRSYEKARDAQIIMLLIDAKQAYRDSVKDFIDNFHQKLDREEKDLLLVVNKVDKVEATEQLKAELEDLGKTVFISAKKKENLDAIKEALKSFVDRSQYSNQTIVSNARHYNELRQTDEALSRVMEGIELGITGDFIAMDIRQALHHLGAITGEINHEDLLDNIFSKFCIGK